MFEDVRSVYQSTMKSRPRRYCVVEAAWEGRCPEIQSGQRAPDEPPRSASGRNLPVTRPPPVPADLHLDVQLPNIPEARRLHAESAAVVGVVSWPDRGNVMAEQQGDRKCAHEGCECMARPGNKYCSDYCQRAGHMTELHCNCQHPECK
jgi:hypothetical protein